MLQLGCDHCLSTEPVVEYGILLVVLVQDLEHHRAAERSDPGPAGSCPSHLRRRHTPDRRPSKAIASPPGDREEPMRSSQAPQSASAVSGRMGPPANDRPLSSGSACGSGARLLLDEDRKSSLAPWPRSSFGRIVEVAEPSDPAVQAGSRGILSSAPRVNRPGSVPRWTILMHRGRPDTAKGWLHPTGTICSCNGHDQPTDNGPP